MKHNKGRKGDVTVLIDNDTYDIAAKLAEAAGMTTKEWIEALAREKLGHEPPDNVSRRNERREVSTTTTNQTWVNEAADRLAVQLMMNPEAFRLRALAMAVQIIDGNLLMDLAPFEVADPLNGFSATEALIGMPIASVLKLERGNKGNFAQRIVYEMHRTDIGKPGRTESAWCSNDPGERQRLRKRERNRAAWLKDDQWLVAAKG